MTRAHAPENKPRIRLAERRKVNGGYPPPNTLECDCWCHAELLDVPIVLIKAVRTLSCGAPGCHGPEVDQ